jgi:hypothetical protein
VQELRSDSSSIICPTTLKECLCLLAANPKLEGYNTYKDFRKDLASAIQKRVLEEMAKMREEMDRMIAAALQREEIDKKRETTLKRPDTNSSEDGENA